MSYNEPDGLIRLVPFAIVAIVAGYIFHWFDGIISFVNGIIPIFITIVYILFVIIVILVAGYISWLIIKYFQERSHDKEIDLLIQKGTERKKVLENLGLSDYIRDITELHLGRMTDEGFSIFSNQVDEQKKNDDKGKERKKLLENLGWSVYNPNILSLDYLGKMTDEDFKQICNKVNEQKEEDERIKESLLFKVIKSIEEFKPTKQWGNENNYHIELMGWLKREFPDIVKYEVQSGASRPDLVIKDIAIEIKGPTDSQALNTLASKLLRYEQYYPNTIIVLFECNFSEKLFQEIQNGVNRHYQKVMIIRK